MWGNWGLKARGRGLEWHLWSLIAGIWGIMEASPGV